MSITRERFTEGSSGFIRGQIVDQNGDPIELDVLTAATLTLYDFETKQVINGRDRQDILASGSPAILNDVEYEGDGYFRWDLQAATITDGSPSDLGDNEIINPRRQMERHRVMFRFTWTGGAFNYEVEIEVENLRLFE